MTHKGYRIEPLGTYPMFKIMAPGSGGDPNSLSGTYTTRKTAMIAIDMSLEKMIKGKKNVKRVSATTR